MRPNPSTLALLFCLVACDGGGSPAPAKEPRARTPDVIVITVDTLRADHVGAWGHSSIETPTMDALATRGARFVNAFTPIPRTTPGLGSLWTGLEPHHHGAREVGHRVQDGTFLSEVLRERGWATRAVSANDAASARTGFDRGFDDFVLHSEAEASRITDTAIAQADSVEARRPLLLWAHYLDPHAPYAAPAGPPTPRCDASLAAPATLRVNDLDGIASDAREECLRAYRAEIEHADREIARLLAHLREAGRLEHAYVVFASDHGEAFGERATWYAHGPNVHHVQLRVPLAIAGPGVEAGASIEAPVGLSDVAPTLCALLDVDDPPAMDGASLSGLLRGEPATPRLLYAESAGTFIRTFDEVLIAGEPGAGWCLHGGRFSLCWSRDRHAAPTLHERALDPLLETDVAAANPEAVDYLSAARAVWMPSGGREHAVFDGRFKLLERPRVEGGYTATLHDLDADPAEALDVSDAHPETAARLRAALEAWRERVPQSAPMAMSAEQRAMLEALGYVP